MPTTQILILRHGEKLDQDGDPNLSPRGYERAAALAIAIPTSFATPEWLFASAPSAESNRPVETLTPLADRLRLPINTKYKDKDYAALAADILNKPKYDGVILIAWHHGEIPSLAAALGARDAPAKWDSAVFDRVWQLVYDDGAVAFTDLPQRLLFGDSAT